MIIDSGGPSCGSLYDDDEDDWYTEYDEQLKTIRESREQEEKDYFDRKYGKGKRR